MPVRAEQREYGYRELTGLQPVGGGTGPLAVPRPAPEVLDGPRSCRAGRGCHVGRRCGRAQATWWLTPEAAGAAAVGIRTWSSRMHHAGREVSMTAELPQYRLVTRVGRGTGPESSSPPANTSCRTPGSARDEGPDRSGAGRARSDGAPELRSAVAAATSCCAGPQPWPSRTTGRA
jgi:hypothetical protein